MTLIWDALEWFCGIGMAAAVIMLAKNEVTYHQVMKVSEAIYRYVINSDADLDTFKHMYAEMPCYEAILFRMLDWGDKNIVSRETYELIKPYFKKER